MDSLVQSTIPYRGASSKSTYRPEIDGLRTFAIIAVIINHFNKDLLPSGYLGVDIFFVISGFVITSSLVSRTYKNFGDFLLGFYSRRVKRIVPALVVCVVITSILICLFNPDTKLSLRTGVASLFGFSNIYLFSQATDYFTTSTELNAFTQTWSLGVEEQFYFVFPVLFWLSGVGRQTKKSSKRLIWITLVMSVASLAVYVYLSQVNQPAAYFLMPSRLWELSSGCLVFFLSISERANYFADVIKKVSPVVILSLMAALLFTPLKFSILATSGVVLLTGALITSLRPKTIAYELLTAPPVVYIGLISYSLYLWHWSVLCISRWTIGIHLWSVPMQLIAMLLLAHYSYRYVENPLRRSKWPELRWKVLSYGLILCSAALSLLLALDRYIGRQFYVGDRAEDLELDRGSISGTSLKPENCSWFHGDGPKLQNAVKDCTLIPKELTYSKRIYVRGDSHAGSLVGLIERLARYNNVQIQLLYVHSQLAPVAPQFYKENEKSWKKKDSKQQMAVEEMTLSMLHQGDIVVLSNALLGYYFRDGDDGRYVEENWLKRLERFAESAQKKGASIVVFLPAPNFSSSDEKANNIILGNCSRQWFRPYLPVECIHNRSRETLIREIRPIKEKLFQLSKRNSNLFLYDPFPQLCPLGSKFCSNYLYGKLAYFDDNHLNNIAGGYLYDDFLAFLRTRKLIH